MKSQLDSTPFQKRSPNPNRRCRSPLDPVDRLLLSVERSVDHCQQKPHVWWSVDLSGRPSWCFSRCACRSTGRSADLCSGLQIDCILAPLNSDLCTISFDELKKLFHQVFISSLPTILHLGEVKISQIRAELNTVYVDSNGLHLCGCLRTLHKGSSHPSSSKRALLSSINWKNMEQLFTICKFHFQNHLGKHISGILLCVNI